MSLLLTVLSWLGVILGAFVAFLLSLVVIEATLESIAWIGQRWRARKMARRRTQPPSRSLALLVDVDDASGLLRPSVQISGPPLGRRAAVQLELVDNRGAVRLMFGRSLPQRAIGVDLPLPAFAPPADLSAAEVLRWRWDVVLEDADGELGRWEEHPAPAGAVNPEGELEMPVRDEASVTPPRVGPGRPGSRHAGLPRGPQGARGAQAAPRRNVGPLTV